MGLTSSMILRWIDSVFLQAKPTGAGAPCRLRYVRGRRWARTAASVTVFRIDADGRCRCIRASFAESSDRQEDTPIRGALSRVGPPLRRQPHDWKHAWRAAHASRVAHPTRNSCRAASEEERIAAPVRQSRRSPQSRNVPTYRSTEIRPVSVSVTVPRSSYTIIR